jgi:hypothetical protein
MKKSSLRLLLLGCASFSMINPANAYFVEIEGSTGLSDTTYEHEETDYLMGVVIESEAEVKTTDYFLDLQVFFNNVTTTTGPLAEAAFLGKTGSAFIQYSAIDITHESDTSISFSPTFSNKTKYDSATIAAGARIIIGPVILEPGYMIENLDIKRLSGIFGDYETETFQLGVGGYITDSQELVFTYSQGETELKKTNSFSFRSDFVSEQETLRYKGVFNIARFYIVPHATLYHYHNDSGYQSQDIEAGVTFYPMKNLGIGPTFKISSDNDYNYDWTNNEITSSVNVSYFPIPALGLNASLGSSSILEKSDDSDSDSSFYESETSDESSGLFFEAGITGRF